MFAGIERSCRLKTDTSHRVVPMAPQLKEILRPYLFGQRPPSKLLFPSFIGGSERLVSDWRKVFDAVAVKAGWQRGEIRSKMFRHTFCAAALQLLDGDEPISVYTVSRWMGHGGTTWVNRRTRTSAPYATGPRGWRPGSSSTGLSWASGPGRGIRSVFDSVPSAPRADRVS